MHVNLFIYQSVDQSVWLGRQQVEVLMLHLNYKISFHPYLNNIVSDHALKYFATITAEGYSIITISIL